MLEEHRNFFPAHCIEVLIMRILDRFFCEPFFYCMAKTQNINSVSASRFTLNAMPMADLIDSAITKVQNDPLFFSGTTVEVTLTPASLWDRFHIKFWEKAC